MPQPIKKHGRTSKERNRESWRRKGSMSNSLLLGLDALVRTDRQTYSTGVANILIFTFLSLTFTSLLSPPCVPAADQHDTIPYPTAQKSSHPTEPHSLIISRITPAASPYVVTATSRLSPLQLPHSFISCVDLNADLNTILHFKQQHSRLLIDFRALRFHMNVVYAAQTPEQIPGHIPGRPAIFSFNSKAVTDDN
ncbi:hypothetical protein VTL71DRAFT_4203 [Oculimacula yallundae]|uniref:Uncharacterized protein n=1 Tax=Oculimacula yallundae TaxID=86028 RepID=A0ABR4C7H1_9HELO